MPRPPKTPRIEYLNVDDEAPTLKRPALDRRAAESVIALSNRPSTIPPLTIDATVERFVASPIADASYDDWTPPPLPVSAGGRALGLVALFVAIAFSSAILGAAAARVSAKGSDVELHWMGVALPGR